MLAHQILLLNRLWQAVNVCSVRRAFSLLCQEHAQVVYSAAQKNYLTHDFDRWRDLNLDHVIPRDKGGLTTWENIVCSCIPCNTRKGNRLPHEAHMHLIRKPARPKWRPFVHLTFNGQQHESWRHFIDLACWSVELGG